MMAKQSKWMARAAGMVMAVVALLAAVRLAPAARAESGPALEYYLVQGRVYAAGYASDEGQPAEITRVQVVDEVPRLESTGGEEYALVSLDEDGQWLYTANLDISFAPIADAGGGQSSYAVFTALVPWDADIAGFAVYDAAGGVLATHWLDAALAEVALFEVEDTGEEYRCSWDVLLYEGYEDAEITFDLLAVSLESGETNMLAYQVSGYGATIPYGYLPPGDTVYFVLHCYDGATRLTAETELYDTPEGVDDTLAADEQWYQPDVPQGGAGGGMLWLVVLAVVLVAVVAALAIVLVVVLNRRKKPR